MGLAAMGCGVIAAQSLTMPDPWISNPLQCMTSVALLTLGGYLALAGHRSHLYQSQTQIAAYLVARGTRGHD